MLRTSLRKCSNKNYKKIIVIIDYWDYSVGIIKAFNTIHLVSSLRLLRTKFLILRKRNSPDIFTHQSSITRSACWFYFTAAVHLMKQVDWSTGFKLIKHWLANWCSGINRHFSHTAASAITLRRFVAVSTGVSLFATFGTLAILTNEGFTTCP